MYQGESELSYILYVMKSEWVIPYLSISRAKSLQIAYTIMSV